MIWITFGFLVSFVAGFLSGNRWAKSRFFYVGKKKKNITQDVLVGWDEKITR
ncbi:MAG: hypothetical protein IKB61_02530 [Elusimicrobiaceae bacterium]|nr:hypothetical protein [Elusimicrobiaceae bacterium]MBR4355381.1 hypothetical protein [Elusimicrobiaceae bacterium]